jgi:hypothetical protein
LAQQDRYNTQNLRFAGVIFHQLYIVKNLTFNAYGGMMKMNRFFNHGLFLGGMFLCTLLQAGQVKAQEASSSTPCHKGINIYGDFIYWKVVQDQLQYAALSPEGIQGFNVQSTNGKNTYTILDPRFEYKPGFRLGLGYESPCSNWDVQSVWTHLTQGVSSSVKDNQNALVPVAVPVATLLGSFDDQLSGSRQAKSRWDFKYDTIDIELGWSCCLGQRLSARPFLGLKVAAIRQEQNIKYLGFSINDVPATIKTNRKNNFYGVGPSIGFDASWEICQDLYLKSSLCGAFVYGRFHASDNPHIEIPGQTLTVLMKNNKKNRLHPTVDFDIGVDSNMCLCNKYQINVGLFYSLQYWWNHWHAPNSYISNILLGGGSSGGDLSMQGITGRLGVTF